MNHIQKSETRRMEYTGDVLSALNHIDQAQSEFQRNSKEWLELADIYARLNCFLAVTIPAHEGPEYTEQEAYEVLESAILYLDLRNQKQAADLIAGYKLGMEIHNLNLFPNPRRMAEVQEAYIEEFLHARNCENCEYLEGSHLGEIRTCPGQLGKEFPTFFRERKRSEPTLQCARGIQ